MYFDKRAMVPDAGATPAGDTHCDIMGEGRCTHANCTCPRYMDPPSGFNCSRCGHPKSEHWD